MEYFEGLNVSLDSWPAIKSEYIEPYNFEIFDLPKAIETVISFRPIVAAVTVGYILSVYLGTEWMKSRAAFKLDRALFLWNAALAVFSLIAFVRAFPEFWYIVNQPSGFYKSICTLDTHNTAMAFWTIVFLYSKFFELGDTLFIVLRKREVIPLHLFHHASALMGGWMAMSYAYDPAAKNWWLVNAFIHIWMYSYFALKALKVNIPEKIALVLTTMQTAQMMFLVVVNAYTAVLLAKGTPCQRSVFEIVQSTALGGTIAFLFAKFFVERYILKKKMKGKME